MLSNEISFSATTFGDYSSDKDSSTVTLGSFYQPILEKRPVKGINLHEGIGNFVDKYGNEKLESLLAFIEKTAKPGQSLKEVVKSDFVCRRGLLRDLAMTDYKNKPYTLLAVRFNGIIFLCEERDLEKEKPVTQGQICGSYYGHKFEQIMTELNPESATPENNFQAKTVLRGSFKTAEGEEHTVLYSGEVDGIDKDDKKLELKLLNGRLDDYWIKNKSLTWYLQSHLANIETILVGERYKNTMQRTYRLKTADIPKLARNSWSASECLQCLHAILTDLKKSLPTDGSAQRIRYEFEQFTHKNVELSSLGLLTPSFMERFSKSL